MFRTLSHKWGSVQHVWSLQNTGGSSMSGFPEIGLPPNHPFLDGIFPNKNHPAIGVPPWLWKPPCWDDPTSHLWLPLATEDALGSGSPYSSVTPLATASGALSMSKEVLQCGSPVGISESPSGFPKAQPLTKKGLGYQKDIMGKPQPRETSSICCRTPCRMSVTPCLQLSYKRTEPFFLSSLRVDPKWQ